MNFCKPKPKSILSLDIGTKRIGLAYCDPLCITSNILPAVKRFENNQEIKIIKNHIRNTIIKNEAKQVNRINQSLESIFEKLSPQGNPYPSPFPLKTK